MKRFVAERRNGASAAAYGGRGLHRSEPRRALPRSFEISSGRVFAPSAGPTFRARRRADSLTWRARVVTATVTSGGNGRNLTAAGSPTVVTVGLRRLSSVRGRGRPSTATNADGGGWQ